LSVNIFWIKCLRLPQENIGHIAVILDDATEFSLDSIALVVQDLLEFIPSQNEHTRVAKLADAPDLGLRNRRFQNVALRFNSKRVYK
jgi:hypothetical protein